MSSSTAAARACMPLAPHECRVWSATIAEAGPHLERLLSGHEQERRRAYVREDDRRRFMVGAALVRLAAAACLPGVDPADVRVDRRCHRCGAQHGKSRLPDHAEIDVTVAHAGEHVAVALARDVRIGIDVERIKDVDVDDLARAAFAPGEAAELAALPEGERRAAFFRTWTAKESIAKALGVGITDGFAGLSAAASGAALRGLPAAPGYVATLAVIGRCDSVSEHDGNALLRGG